MLCRNEMKQRTCLWEHKEDVNKRLTINGRFAKHYAEGMPKLYNGTSPKVCINETNIEAL